MDSNDQPEVGGQKSRFKKKICIKVLPSRMGLKEFEAIHHLNPKYKRANIRCKCGLPYKDHGQEAKNDLYPLVEDLLKYNISVEEFTKDLYALVEKLLKYKISISVEKFTKGLYPLVEDLLKYKISVKEFTEGLYPLVEDLLKYKIKISVEKFSKGLDPLLEDLLKYKISVEVFIEGVYVDPNDENNERQKKGYKNEMMEADGAEMGEIEFQMDTSKSKFTRLSDTTDKDDLKLFLKEDWELLEAEPELIISLIGTTAKKALAEKLAEGILKISRRVNLIILTSGLESDIVAKTIGDAVTREQRWTTEGDKQSSKAKIRCVGITSWGSLKRKPEKEENEKGKFTIKADVNSPFESLVFNPGHAYLLLMDNGTNEELPKDLNIFWAKLEELLKSDSLHVMNLILGNENYEKKNLAMTETLLHYGFPVIFLQHSETYLDMLINSVLGINSVDSQLTDKDKQMIEMNKTFIEKQVTDDANCQRKNVITFCDLLSEDSNNPEVGHNLDSIMLRTFTKPSIVKARVNNREPNHESVLQVLKLAIKWRCWDVSMDQLFTYKYKWKDDEKTRLKNIVKDCLLQDRPTYITVFNRDGWVPMNTFLSLEMLAELYHIPHLVNDPLQEVYRRTKISGDNEDSLKMLVYNLRLPDCYQPEFYKEKGVIMCKHPYKHLLIWAVVSKRWDVVGHILYNQNYDILVWILATAYLCKVVALRQLEEEIRNEYKDKQQKRTRKESLPSKLM